MGREGEVHDTRSFQCFCDGCLGATTLSLSICYGGFLPTGGVWTTTPSGQVWHGMLSVPGRRSKVKNLAITPYIRPHAERTNPSGWPGASASVSQRVPGCPQIADQGLAHPPDWQTLVPLHNLRQSSAGDSGDMLNESYLTSQSERPHMSSPKVSFDFYPRGLGCLRGRRPPNMRIHNCWCSPVSNLAIRTICDVLWRRNCWGCAPSRPRLRKASGFTAMQAWTVHPHAIIILELSPSSSRHRGAPRGAEWSQLPASARIQSPHLRRARAR